MVSTGRIIAVVGFIISLIAGVLAWFVVSSNTYSLVDGYSLVIQYAQTGGKTTFTSGLGSLLNSSASGFGLEVVSLVVVLILWPATVIAGLIELVGGSVRPYPGIYGVIAFIAAYFFTNALTSGTLIVSVGIGAILIIVAAIIFFVAYVVDSTARKRARQIVMQQPVAAPVSQQFTCQACGAKFNTQAELDAHAKSMHPM